MSNLKMAATAVAALLVAAPVVAEEGIPGNLLVNGGLTPVSCTAQTDGLFLCAEGDTPPALEVTEAPAPALVAEPAPVAEADLAAAENWCTGKARATGVITAPDHPRRGWLVNRGVTGSSESWTFDKGAYTVTYIPGGAYSTADLVIANDRGYADMYLVEVEDGKATLGLLFSSFADGVIPEFVFCKDPHVQPAQ